MKMAMDKRLQIKVFHDESDNKCEAIFTEEQAISTYCSLMALMEENLGETYKVSQETTVYCCDDEGSWVQLKPFNDVAVIEMIRCAREVPGTDFKRIKVELQQSEISPPAKSPKAKQLKPSFSPKSSFYQYHERSNPTGGSDLLHARKKATASKRLDYSASYEVSTGKTRDKELYDETASSTPPTERYVESKRVELNLMQDRLLQEHNEVSAFKESHSFTLGGERDDMPRCSKCHLRTGRGHNRLNCDLEKCVSSSFCGKIEKHPEEKSTLKKLEKEEIAVTKDINKLESELKVKEAALESITNRFAYKVRKLLTMSNKDLYTKRLNDGTVI